MLGQNLTNLPPYFLSFNEAFFIFCSHTLYGDYMGSIWGFNGEYVPSLYCYLFSVFGFLLSVFGCRFSVVGYRLSVVGCRLSVICYRLLVVGYLLSVIWLLYCSQERIVDLDLAAPFFISFYLTLFGGTTAIHYPYTIHTSAILQPYFSHTLSIQYPYT